jgi:hypothetical protein
MTEVQWMQVMARIRDTWPEPFVPRLYFAVRTHDHRDAAAALDWLQTTTTRALPAPGSLLEAVSAAKRNRERQGTTIADLPTGQPASAEDRIEAFRRAIRDAIDHEVAGLDDDQAAARAAAVRERFAAISPGMAQAAASL